MATDPGDFLRELEERAAREFPNTLPHSEPSSSLAHEPSSRSGNAEGASNPEGTRSLPTESKPEPKNLSLSQLIWYGAVGGGVVGICNILLGPKYLLLYGLPLVALTTIRPWKRAIPVALVFILCAIAAGSIIDWAALRLGIDLRRKP